MINVKHKNKETLQESQSDFADQAALGLHQAEHPEMYEPTCEVIIQDVTVEVQHKVKKATKKETRLACLELFDDVAIENETADNALMDAIFLNPSFMAIIGALVSGAPKTAKRYVQSLGPSLYSEAKVAEIVAKLDAIITASEG